MPEDARGCGYAGMELKTQLDYYGYIRPRHDRLHKRIYSIHHILREIFRSYHKIVLSVQLPKCSSNFENRYDIDYRRC